MSRPPCPAYTGPIWSEGAERCGCTRPIGHELERHAGHAETGICNCYHECDCGSWWDDSIRKDLPQVAA